MRDPNPRVDGGRLSRLESAGVEVTVGVCEAEARRLNEAFVKYITTRRPFVTSKSAITLDGKIATRSGASRWITGEAARAAGHQLRHANDAILVGIGTVACRTIRSSPRACRDSAAPTRCALWSTAPCDLLPVRRRWPTWRQRQTYPDRHHRVRPTAAKVKALRGTRRRGDSACRPAADGRVNLDALCAVLGERGIASVLVEGGASADGGLA